MKKRIILSVLIVTNAVFSQHTSGLVLRGSIRPGEGSQEVISTGSRWNHNRVRTGKGGGWLSFYSRLNDSVYLELSLGAVGEIEVYDRMFIEEDVKVQGMCPVLFGLRYHLISPANRIAVQPYIGFGSGIYWLGNIRVRERILTSEVTLGYRILPGLYAGGGLDWMIFSWLGLNMDLKYHLVNMDPNHSYSGLETGFGFVFRWGKAKNTGG